MKKILLVAGIIFILSLTANLASSEEAKNAEGAKPLGMKSIELLTGFGLAKLDIQGSYHVIPFFVDLDFDAKPLLEKTPLRYPGLLEFVLEPFVSHIYDPNSNAEIGNNFLIKIGFTPESWKLQPYFKGGLGMLYMTQHTREQGTQFNFNEHAGVGVHYFFKKNLAFTLEYRWRHISNASISKRNSGINTNFSLCGISYSF